jgi:PAS domain-containing protein
MAAPFKKLLARLADAGPLEMQDLLDAFPSYVLVVDEDHRIVAANTRVLAEAHRPEHVVGGYCPSVVHGLDTPVDDCPLAAAVLDDAAHECELYDDVHDRWTLTAVYPMHGRSAEGRRLFLHTALDITASKAAEQREHDVLQREHAALLATIDVTARAVEAKDPYTAGHQRRVAELSAAIAERLGLPSSTIDGVRVAATVHDLGKIGVPSWILNKPGRLTAEEFERIEQHPSIGSEILAPAAFPWPIADIVLQHHERMDGSGYPHGLAGDEIMLEARIIAVADVVEAMSLDRPYRASLGIDAALDFVSGTGAHLFDARVAEACVGVFDAGFSVPSPPGAGLFGAA